MRFAHDTEIALVSAAALVNTWQAGADRLTDRAGLAAFLDDNPYTGRIIGDEAELVGIRVIRERLREVWDAPHRDAVVGLVNRLLEESGARPYLARHDVWDWHLHVTEPDATGTSQRTLLNQASRPRDPSAPSIGSIGARRPSNGEPTISGKPMNLHSNVYSAAITHDGKADCESGQRGYLEKLTTYNDDPNLDIVTDPHIPGAQGPTFTGRPEVPKGQTFSRLPQFGPKLPKELDK